MCHMRLYFLGLAASKLVSRSKHTNHSSVQLAKSRCIVGNVGNREGRVGKDQVPVDDLVSH